MHLAIKSTMPPQLIIGKIGERPGQNVTIVWPRAALKLSGGLPQMGQ
jgi:hypothetical protein